MEQYIPKSALVAEIKERIKTYNKGYANGDDRRADALEVLLHDIDTLEVKEVNLEKELDRIWFDNKFGDMFDNSAVDFANVREICRHFFELGMAVSNKAHKGE